MKNVFNYFFTSNTTLQRAEKFNDHTMKGYFISRCCSNIMLVSKWKREVCSDTGNYLKKKYHLPSLHSNISFTSNQWFQLNIFEYQTADELLYKASIRICHLFRRKVAITLYDSMWQEKRIFSTAWFSSTIYVTRRYNCRIFGTEMDHVEKEFMLKYR